jgi:IMP cyclohydrolase
MNLNTYPGRGILFGKSEDGKNAVMAYFIMGRSENSRNRVFVIDGGGLRTAAFDESKMTDPSLIIYNPVRVLGNKTVVTNGSQTDLFYEDLKQGIPFEKTLNKIRFEPDAPNYTPRISGLLEINSNEFTYLLSIAKTFGGDPNSCQRMMFCYNEPVNGTGHLIHTYKSDADPLPSFEGEPLCTEIPSDIDEFTGLLWNSLNEENKVSLFTRFINLETQEVQTKVLNKNTD